MSALNIPGWEDEMSKKHGSPRISGAFFAQNVPKMRFVIKKLRNVQIRPFFGFVLL